MFFGGISQWAVNGIAKLGLLKYSRDNERDADALGAELLQKKGILYQGFRDFLLKLKRKKIKTLFQVNLRKSRYP